MRLARKEKKPPAKPQAMPGMAGSVQAAMRAAQGGIATASGSGSTTGSHKAKAAANNAKAPTSNVLNPDSGSAISSGSQTAVFQRGSGPDPSDADRTRKLPKSSPDQTDPDHTRKLSSNGDSDTTRKISPSEIKSTQRNAAATRDPIEDALLRNDPVPRHLKEAADDGDATRRVRPAARDEDFAERTDRAARRKTLILLLAAGVAAVGIWLYVSSSPPSTSQVSLPEATPPVAKTDPTPATPPPVVEPLPVAKPEAVIPTVTPPATPPVVSKLENVPPKAVTPPAAPGLATTAKPPVAPVATPPAKTEPVVAKVEPPKATPATPATNPDGTPVKTTLTLDDVRKKLGEDVPKTFDEQMELAQRLVERYKYENAATLYEYMMGYAPNVPAIYNGLGTCAFERNRGEEALGYYKTALEKRPTYSAAVFGLAKTYHRLLNNKEQAIANYKKYLELSPKGSGAAVAKDSLAKLEGTAPAPTPAPATP